MRRLVSYSLCLMMIVFAALVISGCSPAAEPTHQAYAFQVDCVWEGEAEVWLDKNGDGVRGQDETEAGKGVRIYVVDKNGNQVDSGTTDANGKLQLWVNSKCPPPAFEVFPDVQDEYRITTKARQTSGFKFGLAEKIQGGKPQALDCRNNEWKIPINPGDQAFVTDFHATTDGQVYFTYNVTDTQSFVTGYYGAINTTAEGRPLVQSRVDQGLPVKANAIEKIAEGFIVGTDNGVKKMWDGSMLAGCPNPSGGNIQVYDMKPGEGSTLWLATSNGVYHYDLATGKCSSFADFDHWSGRVIKVLQSSPQVAWAVKDNVISRYSISGTGLENPTITHYRLPESSIKTDDTDFTFRLRPGTGFLGADGSLWIAGEGPDKPGDTKVRPVIQRLKLDGIWESYSTRSTDFGLVEDQMTSLAIAPDQTLWIGTRGSGLVHYIPANQRILQDQWTVYLTNIVEQSQELSKPVPHLYADKDYVNEPIDYVYVDQNNNIWVASGNVIRSCTLPSQATPTP